MKFQNPSLNFFLNGWTDAHTHTRTDGQAETNMLPLFQSWGHKKRHGARKKGHGTVPW